MRRLVLWAFVLFVLGQVGGLVPLLVCDVAAEPRTRPKATTAPQAKPPGERPAHLYFLRERGLWGTEVGIKIDGQTVGSVSKGFYFSVDSPPGRHLITCVNQMSRDYEVEFQIEAGQTYYFGIGSPHGGAVGQDLINQAISGSSGQQLRSTSLISGFSSAALYQIDAAEGPAIINQLKPK